jgi:hypothetical protein
VLRPRPTPYHATYLIFRIDDRRAGREPMRQGLPQFVVTRGGEYGFLPGLRAMKWLGDLEG